MDTAHVGSARKHPRISLNKLGEYLTATPARRRTIIRDQKYPPTFQVMRYSEAERAIIDYFTEGRREDGLLASIGRLSAQERKTEFDAQRVELCLDALHGFLETVDDLGLEGATLVQGEAEPPLLEVAGVALSVRPEIIVRTPEGEGDSRLGLVKLYFSKTHPLDETSAQYVGAVLQHFATHHLGAGAQPHHTLFRVVDVLASKVYRPSRAVTRRLSDVQAACEEIAARWASI
jgi:hypothetical protein